MITINNNLQLSPIQVSEEYLKEWNDRTTDFVVLTKNGELLSNSLYRTGWVSPNIKQDYFMLLKYVESTYDLDFLKKIYPNKKDKELNLMKKHLEGCWCIIDKNGVERKVFSQFENPYLVNDSCIYSLENKYYNIETGEFYCNSSCSMNSSEYLFLENKYDKDLSKKGIMKINKKDGSWSIFS